MTRKKGDGPVPDERNSTANNKLQNVFLDKQFIIVYLFVFASCTRVYCHAVSRACPSIWIKILIHCKSFEVRMIWKQKKKQSRREHSFLLRHWSYRCPFEIYALIYSGQKRSICIEMNLHSRSRILLISLISMKLNAINSFWSVNKMKWNEITVEMDKNSYTVLYIFGHCLFFPLRFSRIWIGD